MLSPYLISSVPITLHISQKLILIRNQNNYRFSNKTRGVKQLIISLFVNNWLQLDLFIS